MPDDQYHEVRSAAEKIPAADQSLVAELMRGALLSARELFRFDFARQGLQQRWRVLFQNFDVVVCPPAATPAFPHDHTEPPEHRKIVVDGEEFPYDHLLVWADPATTCGLPATVVPIAIADGLPIGVQIIGPEYEDRTPLAFARLSSANSAGSPPRRATLRA